MLSIEKQEKGGIYDIRSNTKRVGDYNYNLYLVKNFWNNLK